jgi:oligoribonuclease NrnB/cAMP/cGMP phosphodiesterase (DHH superfamily)
MKVLVITHKNCQDGFFSQCVVKKKYPDATVLQLYPGTHLPQIEESYDIIYMTDISFLIDEMTELSKQTTLFIVLDHHKTAKEELNKWINKPKNVQCIFDMDRCGAVITWNYIYPGTEVPSVIKYVDDRDRWMWKQPSSREINRGLFEANVVDDEKNAIKLFTYTNKQLYDEFYETGKNIIDTEKIIMDELLTKSYNRSYTFNDNIYIITFVDDCPPHLRSDVGNLLAEKSCCHVGATWRVFEDTTVGISLRRVMDFDLTTIGAKGHPGAAGISVSSIEEFDKMFIKGVMI